jgi:prevent-host-death family protein
MDTAALSQRNDHYTDHMVRQVTATLAKAQLLALLDDVQDGEIVEITRHGRVIARIVPASGAHAMRGRHAGVVSSNTDEEGLFSTGVEWELD